MDGNAEMIDETNTNIDPIERLFGIELESTVKNVESEAEPDQITKEKVLKLSCHIDNDGKPISNLSDGIDISLSGEMEKYSDVL